MNRFKIILGCESDFEDVWRNRESHLDEVEGLEGIITSTEFIAYQLTNDFIEKLQREEKGISKVYSIKMILNESHVASASYEKIFE